MPGSAISPVEVIQVTRHGLWLAVGDDEYFLDFGNFPWFKKAAIDAICAVEEPGPGHFHWPLLDIDLDIETILHPERFPLLDQAKGLKYSAHQLSPKPRGPRLWHPAFPRNYT